MKITQILTIDTSSFLRSFTAERTVRIIGLGDDNRIYTYDSATNEWKILVKEND